MEMTGLDKEPTHEDRFYEVCLCACIQVHVYVSVHIYKCPWTLAVVSQELAIFVVVIEKVSHWLGIL